MAGAGIVLWVLFCNHASRGAGAPRSRAINEHAAALDAFPAFKVRVFVFFFVCNTRSFSLTNARAGQAYHATDGLVSRDEVLALATGAAAAGTGAAVLVLVPLRLGIRAINDVYFPKLQRVLEQPQCVGVLGGRPRQSLYFIGYQEDSLIGLDPHLCRLALDMNNPATSLLVRPAAGVADTKGPGLARS